jgi:hypothetical protein
VQCLIPSSWRSGNQHLVIVGETSIFVVFWALIAPAQDWQACRPEGDYSYNDVKAAVYRVTSSRMYSGWDEKTFNRSGDLVAVAVLKMLDDSEIGSSEHAKDILLILRSAFACHLNEITGRKMLPSLA